MKKICRQNFRPDQGFRRHAIAWLLTGIAKNLKAGKNPEDIPLIDAFEKAFSGDLAKQKLMTSFHASTYKIMGPESWRFFSPLKAMLTARKLVSVARKKSTKRQRTRVNCRPFSTQRG